MIEGFLVCVYPGHPWCLLRRDEQHLPAPSDSGRMGGLLWLVVRIRLPLGAGSFDKS